MPLDDKSLGAKMSNKVKAARRFTVPITDRNGNPRTLEFAALNNDAEPSPEVVQEWYERYAFPREGFCHIPTGKRDPKTGEPAHYVWCYLIPG